VTLAPAWRLIAWVCTAHVVSMLGFSCYPTLLPQLQSEWSMSNAAAGLVSGLFFAGYMMLAPILSSLTDRYDPRRIYFASALAIAAGLLGMAMFAEGVVSAALCQILAGAGFAGTYMPGLRTLTDHLEGRTQSRAVSFYTAVFGVGISLSVLAAGAIASALGWRAAFALAALGPPIAAAMMLAVAPRPRSSKARAAQLFDFRPVLRSRPTMTFTIGYAVHCWELFGSRSWMVAFLVYAERASGGTWLAGPIALAALANLAAPLASIAGNEIALRAGRGRVIRAGMMTSGVLTCLLGASSGMPWLVLAGLVVLHMMLVMSDSSALTAGMVASAAPEWRGTAMALHSTLGFGAGFVAPLAFGAVLDAAGGNQAAGAWSWAFAALGAVAVAAPLLLRFGAGAGSR
jgi:MFS family permease